jgi:Ca-activated chloride channel family protein
VSGPVWTRAELWPLLLLLVPLAALLWWLLTRRLRALAAYGAVPAGSSPSPLGRSLRLTTMAGLGLLAWMDPRWGEESVVVERRGLDLVLCIDVSRSMLARDLEPTRLARAVADVRAVLPELSRGDRVALVAFAGRARLMIPLTHDVDSFRQLLAELDTDAVSLGGSDLAAALEKARECATGDLATTSVILMTDGEDLGGSGRAAAARLASEGIVIHAIGYGSARGSKITVLEQGREQFLKDESGAEVVSAMDEAGLAAIAGASGGEFLRAESMALPLRQLHEMRIRPAVQRSYDAGEELGLTPRYQWLLLPLLLLLAWEILARGGSAR